MKIVVNKIPWNILYVPSNSPNLLRSDGSITLGVTDRNVNCVFISNSLRGELLYKVICHELCHVYVFSYDVYISLDEEERMADFISSFGKSIIADTDYLFSNVFKKIISR